MRVPRTITSNRPPAPSTLRRFSECSRHRPVDFLASALPDSVNGGHIADRRLPAVVADHSPEMRPCVSRRCRVGLQSRMKASPTRVKVPRAAVRKLLDEAIPTHRPIRQDR